MKAKAFVIKQNNRYLKKALGVQWTEDIINAKTFKNKDEAEAVVLDFTQFEAEHEEVTSHTYNILPVVVRMDITTSQNEEEDRIREMFIAKNDLDESIHWLRDVIGGFRGGKVNADERYFIKSYWRDHDNPDLINVEISDDEGDDDIFDFPIEYLWITRKEICDRERELHNERVKKAMQEAAERRKAERDKEYAEYLRLKEKYGDK